MNDLVIVSISVLLAILIIVLIKQYRKTTTDEEGWYPTTTYVNTPTQRGVYPMQPNNWWGGNYYYRLNWRPWGYHHPGYYYRRGPVLDAIKSPYINYSALPYSASGGFPFARSPASQVGISPTLSDSSSNPDAPIPYGNPVPLDTIRWRYPYRPMLTSIQSPKDYAVGQWVLAGSGYTDNPNDFTYLSVYQLNLDPGRDLFSYAVKNKAGQIIPINLRPNHDRLEDGDRFKVQGMEGKGDFVFSEADKYTYVYT